MSESFAMTPGADQGGPLHARLVAELPALRAYLRRLAGGRSGRADVEDLVQDVVARALKYRAAFDSERALAPWLRRTALRTFLDHRARRARAPEALDEAPASTERSLERVDQREDLARALECLSSVERDVLVRFHARGQSVREIAGALALAEGTVKSHLHRARRKLAGGPT